MADPKDWSSNANEVLQISLKRSKTQSSPQDVTFNPAFTYPIFGNEETIFGYQGLKIKLDFTCDTLKPSLKVTSTATFPPLGDTEPDNIDKALEEVLSGLGVDIIERDEAFTPPGELLHKYERGGREFGIWSTSLKDPKAKALLRNMQVMILFFIEGGTYIELDDPDWTMERWRVFFVYAIDPPADTSAAPSYSLVGYCTAYTLFFLEPPKIGGTALSDAFALTSDDDTLLHSLPVRSRISQFLILPPYQSSGHGSELYNTIYSCFLEQPNTVEIPVEDPNESFDDLRDTCDILRVRQDSPAFNSISINTQVTLPPRKSQGIPTAALLDQSVLKSIRSATKIAERQFARLVEMQLLSRIPPGNRQVSRLTRRDKASDPNDRAYYFWRLLVKQRLYKHNKESLIQLDRDEKLSKLEETLNAVEKDYLRLLDGAERKARARGDAASKAGASEKAPRNLIGRGIKRKAVDELFTDDDVSSEVGTPSTNGRSKAPKRRIVEEDEDE